MQMSPRKHLIITVNYNNSNFTNSLILTAFGSSQLANIEIHVIVVDNSSSFQLSPILSSAENIWRIHVLTPSFNIGYFNGINYALKNLPSPARQYESVTICNNDILFTPEYFHMLNEYLPTILKYPVICPQIISSSGRFENPHVLTPLGFKRELIYSILYSSFPAYQLLTLISALFGRPFKRFSNTHNKQYTNPIHIYQGYGAAFILTRKFFEYFSSIDYPAFLYFEEFFLSEQIAKHGFLPLFIPNLLLLHMGGASTARMQKRISFRSQKTSFDYYRRLVSLLPNKSKSLAIRLFTCKA